MWTIKTPLSFIAKFLAEREASVEGTVPGSGPPGPRRSRPSGQHRSLLFGLNSRRCLRVSRFFITW